MHSHQFSRVLAIKVLKEHAHGYSPRKYEACTIYLLKNAAATLSRPNGHPKSSAVGKGTPSQVQSSSNTLHKNTSHLQSVTGCYYIQVQSSFNLQVISNGRIGPKKVNNAFAPSDFSNDKLEFE